jgi:hypothetical protein
MTEVSSRPTGVLVRALTRAGKLDEARERANLGYSVAQGLGHRAEAADFLVDLGTIAVQSNQLGDTLAFWREAALALAGAGRGPDRRRARRRLRATRLHAGRRRHEPGPGLRRDAGRAREGRAARSNVREPFRADRLRRRQRSPPEPCIRMKALNG